jgi:electron transport complex protein RnfG
VAQDTATRQASVWSSASILAILAAVCTALVAFTHQSTRERIAANEQAWLEQSLKPVLDGINYEGKLSDSTLVIDPPHELPGSGPATIYRMYADDAPIAALFVVTPRNGYSGPIKILVGIDAEGVLNKARILEHRETPGLGDRIESSKSDWMDQFNKTSLSAPDLALWAISEDGGEFDALTGASITSRAVVTAIRETLIYFADNRERVFARATPTVDDKGSDDEH